MINEITTRLDFIRQAERLKDTLRSAYTRSGKTESVAEHSWRLTLLAMTFADLCPAADTLRLLKLCIIHDLGEVVNGDIPAPQQSHDKSASERADFQSLLVNLPLSINSELTALWDEYESAQSTEAKIAKALDKIETIMQHNQGSNPHDFDYRFNLHYGKNYTDATDLTKEIRAILDSETQNHHNEQNSLTSQTLKSVEIKPFVPASDFENAKNFYRDLGFTEASDTNGVAYFYHGNCSFLLQQCAHATPSTPLMMHLLVEDVARWHAHIVENKIAARYNVNLSPVTDQPWGMREFMLSDPNHVQWRIAQNI